jgi:hypothetical protein
VGCNDNISKAVEQSELSDLITKIKADKELPPKKTKAAR